MTWGDLIGTSLMDGSFSRTDLGHIHTLFWNVSTYIFQFCIILILYIGQYVLMFGTYIPMHVSKVVVLVQQENTQPDLKGIESYYISNKGRTC
jgi:hypothetical protein